MARRKEKGQEELAVWQGRRLDEREAVDGWVEGGDVTAGFEKGKAALLVVLAALSERSRRGIGNPRRVGEPCCAIGATVGCGRRGSSAAMGIWNALRQVYPEAEEQRCWNPKLIQVLDKLPKRQQAAGTVLLRQIPAAPTRREAERRREQFVAGWTPHGYADAAQGLVTDWERLVSFSRFPQHLRTSHPVESPFGAARLRTDAAKRFKVVKHATAVMWKMRLVAEQAFRRVKHPGLMPVIDRGGTCVDGMLVNKEVVA